MHSASHRPKVQCPMVATPAANKLTYCCPGPDGATGEGLPEEHEGDHGRGGAAPHVPGGGAPQRRPARPRHPRHHHGRSWSRCHEVTRSRGHAVTLSRCHAVTRSRCHEVTLSCAGAEAEPEPEPERGEQLQLHALALLRPRARGGQAAGRQLPRPGAQQVR